MDRDKFDYQFIKFVKDIKREFDINFEKKLKGIKNNNMIRGNNPSLSHVVENKFAELLYTIFSHKNYLYLIDVNLTTKLNGESKSIRPDIVVIERETNEIKAIFEMKIDDARANDEWVKMSNDRLIQLKKISKNIQSKDNYIRYTTIKINDSGKPVKTRNGRYSSKINSIRCSPDAKVACITLCKENSRKIKETDHYRTSGEFTLYLSDKHFNNQNHSFESIISKENLKADELYELILNMKLDS
jgi:hypothetical protein